MSYDKCTGEMDYEDCVPDHSQSNSNNHLIDETNEVIEGENADNFRVINKTNSENSNENNYTKSENKHSIKHSDYLLNKSELKQLFSESNSIDDTDRYALLDYI